MSAPTIQDALEWIDTHVHPEGDLCECQWCVLYWNLILIQRSLEASK
jgi:hypothetical protein